ncbi:opioid growth factor receptor-like protein 1 isoform X2 [Protopterus annectens]|uniref:opioid growth factor receptor-like protein 1 isoform X2 n=1 Tax=Protopterus annectens TaxID=7888 RepID=UPI001CF97C6C|nr:opioid growth factor receptor-like protein 1 isoform X2 [Protopterus annectens]
MGNFFGLGISLREPTSLEECDSTWNSDSETEEYVGDRASGQTTPTPERKDDTGEEETEQTDRTIEPIPKPKRSFYAAKDLFKYRHKYPKLKDMRYHNDLCNLRFYMNKIPFKPEGVYIEDILSRWKGDYEKLEQNHTYIQWLFPLREQGLNFYAKELTTLEIEEFMTTKEAVKRYLLAYKLMLDFFGIRLVDKNGNVARASNWCERFKHLNESQHNYLRITRILKSLGELGYEHFKPPLVKFLLQEALVEETIPNIKHSALEYFVYTIRARKERRRLLRFAQQHYTPAESFIWGPPKKIKTEERKVAVKPTDTPSVVLDNKVTLEEVGEHKNQIKSETRSNENRQSKSSGEGSDTSASSPELNGNKNCVDEAEITSDSECHNFKDGVGIPPPE